MSLSRVTISTRLVEAAGSATAYFHRLLNDIIDSLNGVSGQSGVTTVSPNGSGDVTVTHGYAAPGHPPAIATSVVQPSGTTAFHPQIVSVTSTALTVRLFDMAGAPLVSGSYALAWRVSG